MKFYIPFGDWSGDGHQHYEKVLVEAESMGKLLEAENKIKAIYGEKFFDGYAEAYDHPKLAPECWQALIDNDMPIDILETSEMLDPEEDDKIYNLQDYLNTYPNPYVSLEFVKYSFIFLLNQYGAKIKIIEEPYIPQINNWTCSGFKTVGYGCFD